MSVETGEFEAGGKVHQMCLVKDNPDDRGCQFGLGKAKMAMENLQQLSEVVLMNDKIGADDKDIVVTLNPSSRYPWEVTYGQARRIVRNPEGIAEWIQFQEQK